MANRISLRRFIPANGATHFHELYLPKCPHFKPVCIRTMQITSCRTPIETGTFRGNIEENCYSILYTLYTSYTLSSLE